MFSTTLKNFNAYAEETGICTLANLTVSIFSMWSSDHNTHAANPYNYTYNAELSHVSEAYGIRNELYIRSTEW